MSAGFRVSEAERIAREQGMSFREACRMMGRRGAKKRNQRRRVAPCAPAPEVDDPKREPWWLRY